MYEQLQDMLNKAIAKWRSYCFLYKGSPYDRECGKLWISNWEEWDSFYMLSYHDLFSKDSWLMDYMSYVNYTDILIDRRECGVDSHYMIMWPMTSEDKCKYFLQNAYLD